MLKLATLFAAFILPFISGCPPAETLGPCKCSTSGQVICPGLRSEQTLIDAIRVFKTRKEYYSLTIEKGRFKILPSNIFNGTRFVELKIISSTFTSLTDTDVAFEGLEDELRSLIITNTTFAKSWNWALLRNLKNIIELRVEAGLNSISGDIKNLKLTHLKELNLANNYITRVHDTAFSSFESLSSIALRNNAITELKRSMLPNPANSLWGLDLSHNDIQQLPSDMFSNMPSLTVLSLVHNRLLTINEKPFSEVWTQLQNFDAYGNPLRCDCRMTWMTKLKKPGYLDGACDQPRHLKGKILKDITEKDLWC